MGGGKEDNRDGREKDRKRDGNGRKKERQGWGERKIERETGAGERQGWERERERHVTGDKRRIDRGEGEKSIGAKSSFSRPAVVKVINLSCSQWRS